MAYRLTIANRSVEAPIPSYYQPFGKTIATMRSDLAAGQCSSVELAQSYLARINLLNTQLRAVIAINPHALASAARADASRISGKMQPPLAGIPILIKDTIETSDGMPTTAGSLALKNNMNGQDAFVVERLRKPGAIILGKTNLSEWSNARSSHAISGWSSIGGQTRNPYATDSSACGSSSGSGSPMAAEMAAGSLGVESDGSIACPVAMFGGPFL